MHNLPNLITLLRLVLVPVMAFCLGAGAYAAAAVVFLVAALSDFADGYIARRFAMVSKLGAFLDPIADKLNMLFATVLLAWEWVIPLWLAAAIIGRDVVIVGGALAWRHFRGELTVKPTSLSKANTVLEFAVLVLVMAVAAGWLAPGAWLEILFVVLLATVVASGVQYVWLWGRAAIKGPAPTQRNGTGH
jgi:cardiolipin synthase